MLIGALVLGGCPKNTSDDPSGAAAETHSLVLDWDAQIKEIPLLAPRLGVTRFYSGHKDMRHIRSPLLSPDKKQIYFVGKTRSRWAIWSQSSDTSDAAKPLVVLDEKMKQKWGWRSLGDLALSPDGRHLVFGVRGPKKEQGLSPQFGVFDLKSRRLSTIPVEGVQQARTPTFVQDGNVLAFADCARIAKIPFQPPATAGQKAQTVAFVEGIRGACPLWRPRVGPKGKDWVVELQVALLTPQWQERLGVSSSVGQAQAGTSLWRFMMPMGQWVPLLSAANHAALKGAPQWSGFQTPVFSANGDAIYFSAGRRLAKKDLQSQGVDYVLPGAVSAGNGFLGVRFEERFLSVHADGNWAVATSNVLGAPITIPPGLILIDFSHLNP
ncbi:MAG: hypothetical protein CMH56_13475 [Myxococcales bacterium]|nr:hypothetical protein [Myxococcales bacterium]